MLYYETIEKDSNLDWVVFVHGIGGSILTWKKQIDEFSENHNLLLLDLAGHGKSNNIKVKNSIINVPKDIKEILDYLNIKRAHFVGMSLGTLILIFYTLIYSETVISLTMGGAIAGITRKCNMIMWFAQKLKMILPKKTICSLFSFILLPKKNHKKSRKIFIRETFKIKKEELISWINTLEIIKYSNTYLKMLKNLKEIPILYIMGSEDHIFLKGVKNSIEKMKNAKLKIIKHCGHVCTIEKYKEFNKLALSFIEGNMNNIVC